MSKEDDKQNLDGENYEIEIEYVDEFGRPVSPPHSGMPAPFGPPPPMPFGPPPPPFGMPPFPPPPMQWIEEEIEEEVDETAGSGETPRLGESSPSSAQPQTAFAPPPPPARVSHEKRGKEFVANKNVKAHSMMEEGRKRARANARSSIVDVYLRILKGILIMSGLTAVAVGLAIFAFSILNDGAEETGGAADGAGDSLLIGYRLGNTPAENLVRQYYEAVGDNDVGAWSDIMLKGFIHVNGKTEEFYCIKKSNGRTFAKIGITDNERSYIVGPFGEGVVRLLDGRVSGRKELLSERDALAMRAIVSIDDPLFSRAFEQARDVDTTLSKIVDEGEVDFNGKTCNALAMVEQDGTRVAMYLDAETHLLDGATYLHGENKITVAYSKYRDQNGLMIPTEWTVSDDGREYAKVEITYAVKDKGFFFPQ